MIFLFELVDLPTMRSATALCYHLYMYFFLSSRRNAIKRKREDEFFFAENFKFSDQDQSVRSKIPKRRVKWGGEYILHGTDKAM